MLTDVQKEKIQLYILIDLTISIAAAVILLVFGIFYMYQWLLGVVTVLVIGVGITLRLSVSISSDRRVKGNCIWLIVVGIPTLGIMAILAGVYGLGMIAHNYELKHHAQKQEKLHDEPTDMPVDEKSDNHIEKTDS